MATNDLAGEYIAFESECAVTHRICKSKEDCSRVRGDDLAWRRSLGDCLMTCAAVGQIAATFGFGWRRCALALPLGVIGNFAFKWFSSSEKHYARAERYGAAAKFFDHLSSRARIYRNVTLPGVADAEAAITLEEFREDKADVELHASLEPWGGFPRGRGEAKEKK